MNRDSFKAMAVVLAISVGLMLPRAVSARTIGCIECHTDAEKLKEITKAYGPKGIKLGRGGPATERPRFERVLISEEFFEDEDHGAMECIECHGGDPEARDFDLAHTGVDRDPSYPAPGVCDECHDETEHYAGSLHYTVKGMMTPLLARAGDDPKLHAEINAVSGECTRCHASCGQCHVNQPVHAGGGFIAGHAFQARATDSTCAACHGFIVDEFKGKIKDAKPDIHFSDEEMDCLDCHTPEQMHGDGNQYAHRYEDKNMPSCLNCHEEIYDSDSDYGKGHNAHKGKVSCYVCHSQAYTNCAECHLSKDWEEGKFKKWYALKAGFNPTPDRRPEHFVTLRHVPVYRDFMEFYVKGDGLPEFDRRPTWAMSSPHNIQRVTQQNQECNNCHGNWDMFLLLRDVAKDEHLANRPVIVPPGKIPLKINE